MADEQQIKRMIALLEERREGVRQETLVYIQDQALLASINAAHDFHSYTDEIAKKGREYQRLTAQLDVLRWVADPTGMYPW